MSEHKGFIRLTRVDDSGLMILANEILSVEVETCIKGTHTLVNTTANTYRVKETVDQIAALLNSNAIAVSGIRMNKDNKMVIEEDYCRNGLK